MRKLFCLLLIIFSLPIFAATAQHSDGKVYRVGVVLAPPFTTIQNDTFHGFMVAVWRNLAEHGNIRYRFVNAGTSAQKGVEMLRNNKIDVLVGPISVTASRLKLVEFSRPVFINKLSTVTRDETASFWHVIWHMVKTFLSFSILVYVILLFIYAYLHWYFERRKGVEEFQGNFVRSYIFSLWNGLLAFLTNGYERSGESIGARALMIVWMIVSVVFLSTIIATITSSVTISNTALSVDSSGKIKSLYQRKVAAQENSYASGVATRLGARLTTTPDLEHAFSLLSENKVNAVLGNYLTLKYYIRRTPEIDYSPDPIMIGANEMAFAFRKGSPLRAQTNALLAKLQDNNLAFGICERYLSPKDSQDCII